MITPEMIGARIEPGDIVRPRAGIRHGTLESVRMDAGELVYTVHFPGGEHEELREELVLATAITCDACRYVPRPGEYWYELRDATVVCSRCLASSGGRPSVRYKGEA